MKGHVTVSVNGVEIFKARVGKFRVLNLAHRGESNRNKNMHCSLEKDAKSGYVGSTLVSLRPHNPMIYW